MKNKLLKLMKMARNLRTQDKIVLIPLVFFSYAFIDEVLEVIAYYYHIPPGGILTRSILDFSQYHFFSYVIFVCIYWFFFGIKQQSK